MTRARERSINRYYDPATGQFVSVDPMVSETNQPYAYAGDDPVDGADPLGLNPFTSGWHNFASGFDATRHGLAAANNWVNNHINTAVCEDLPGPNRGSLAGWLQTQAGCGVGNQASVSSNAQASASCPLFAGALNSGSSADEARAAANNAGYDIPSNYVATPAGSGKGWVFSPPDAQGDQNAIRVMEPTVKYSNGYVRTYNSQGYPTDAQGNQIGSKGVGQEETHFPLPPDEFPFEG
jgi:uncharacterized protein RhaS with RHS repeats